MPANLKLNFIASYQWVLFQGVLCCCALIAMVMLPLAFWQTASLVVVLLAYSYYLWVEWCSTSMTLCLQQEHILLNERPVLLRSAVVWPWLVVLSLKDVKSQKLSQHLIFADCCTTDEHRQLRAYLRFYKSSP